MYLLLLFLSSNSTLLGPNAIFLLSKGGAGPHVVVPPSLSFSLSFGDFIALLWARSWFRARSPERVSLYDEEKEKEKQIVYVTTKSFKDYSLNIPIVRQRRRASLSVSFSLSLSPPPRLRFNANSECKSDQTTRCNRVSCDPLSLSVTQFGSTSILENLESA